MSLFLVGFFEFCTIKIGVLCVLFLCEIICLTINMYEGYIVVHSYKIVEAKSISDLQKNVQVLLSQGYECLGGVCVYTSTGPLGGDNIFCQTLIPKTKR